MSTDPWWRRLLDNPPPVPARLWELMLMSALVLVGMLLGLTLYAVRQEPASFVTTHTLQQQLQNFEHRLRALERR
jgi:cytochrome c-type biogenesis protein CcmE